MVSNISKQEQDLLDEAAQDGGLLRKLMDTNERKLANQLVKRGLLDKGTSDDKQGTVCFFTSYKYLKSLKADKATD